MKDQTTFVIGTSGKGFDSKDIAVNAMVLSDTRALINASSGLGKSWLLRLIAENVASSIQTILIDPEGEFSTLREKLDILIVSETGDLRADIRSARLLARRLAETGVSAVIDLYDLPGTEDPWLKRRMFVSEFLSELMNLPKKFYHPMLVKVDEAHQFAQEKPSSDYMMWNGKKVFPALLSRSAIRSMMSAGRKRGIGGLLATQRISKIDKDSIADVRNYFIGGATLDIDQQRAGDILGMSKAESVALRDLEPGTFYAFGPAIEGKGIIRFVSSQVKTTHPKAGQRASIVVPKASTQIAGIVEQFGDLPAIAEEEAQTVETLQKEVTDLRRQLRARPTEPRTDTKIERVEVPVIRDEQLQVLEAHVEKVQRATQEVRSVRQEIEQLLNGKIVELNAAALSLSSAIEAARKAPKPGPARVTVVTPASQPIKIKSVSASAPLEGQLPEGENKILSVIAQYPDGVTSTQLTVLTGYKRSTRNTYLQRLGQRDAIQKRGDRFVVTETGLALVDVEPLPTGEELRAHWLRELPQGERAIFEILLAAWPSDVDREDIDGRTGYSRSTRNTYIQRMQAKELVVETGRGRIKASDHLWESG